VIVCLPTVDVPGVADAPDTDLTADIPLRRRHEVGHPRPPED
jgi:hypothetical protein